MKIQEGRLTLYVRTRVGLVGKNTKKRVRVPKHKYKFDRDNKLNMGCAVNDVGMIHYFVIYCRLALP